MVTGQIYQINFILDSMWIFVWKLYKFNTIVSSHNLLEMNILVRLIIYNFIKLKIFSREIRKKDSIKWYDYQKPFYWLIAWILHTSNKEKNKECFKWIGQSSNYLIIIIFFLDDTFQQRNNTKKVSNKLDKAAIN